MIDSGIKQTCKYATKPKSSYTFSSCSWLEIMDRFLDKNKAQRSMEITFHRRKSKEKKKRRKRKRKETFKSVAEEDPAILDYKEIPVHGWVINYNYMINH